MFLFNVVQRDRKLFMANCLSAMRYGVRSVGRPEEELGSEGYEWSGYQKSLNPYTRLITKN